MNDDRALVIIGIGGIGTVLVAIFLDYLERRKGGR